VRLPEGLPASEFPFYGEVTDIQATVRTVRELNQRGERVPELTLLVTEQEVER
jgi:hypothetical protein